MAEFNPANYMMKLKGKDYLEVKHRLVWLRTEHPSASIQTEMVQLDIDKQFALFKATVRIPDGGDATGWGSETGKDFNDYVEKGETKALGRALAALGYGTQFCDDFEFGSGAIGGKEKVVDSPVDRAQYRSAAGETNGHGGGNEDKATDGQVKAMFAIAKTLGYDSDGFTDYCQKRFGAKPVGLPKATATKLIDYMKKNNALPPLKAEAKSEAKAEAPVPDGIDPNAKIPHTLAKTIYDTAIETKKMDKAEVKKWLQDNCGVERIPDLTFAAYARFKEYVDGCGKRGDTAPTGFANI